MRSGTLAAAVVVLVVTLCAVAGVASTGIVGTLASKLLEVTR